MPEVTPQLMTVLRPINAANWAKFNAQAAGWASEAENNLPDPAGPASLDVIDPRKAWEWIRLLPNIAALLSLDILADPASYGGEPVKADCGYEIDINSLDWLGDDGPVDPGAGPTFFLYAEIIPTTPLGQSIIGWGFELTIYATADLATPLLSKSGASVIGGTPTFTNYVQIDSMDISAFEDGNYTALLTWAGPTVSVTFDLETPEPPP